MTTGHRGFADMELSTSEYRRFAEESRQLAKSAKTVEEREFLREREASWVKLAQEAEKGPKRTSEITEMDRQGAPGQELLR
jgi:hypothetical protein